LGDEDAHLQLFEWLDEHPTGSLRAAAQALGLQVTEVEALCAELVAAGMIERTLVQ
jgi:DNA-binding IclR family transcriptional regulator